MATRDHIALLLMASRMKPLAPSSFTLLLNCYRSVTSCVPKDGVHVSLTKTVQMPGLLAPGYGDAVAHGDYRCEEVRRVVEKAVEFQNCFCDVIMVV